MRGYGNDIVTNCYNNKINKTATADKWSLRYK